MAQDAFELSGLGPIIVGAINVELGGDGWQGGGSGGATTFLGLSDIPDSAEEGQIAVYRSGTFVFETKPTSTGSTAWGDITGTLADQTDLATALDGKVTQAQVDAAIAALVDSSPTTLDTLNELSAALNDDPDFGATVTASLASKADADTAVTSDPTGIPGFSRVPAIYAADSEHARTDWQASPEYDPQALVIVE